MKRCSLQIIVFAGVLFSCKDSDIKSVNIKSNTEHIVTDDADIDFKTFIVKFSKDSLFQISRIKFPLIVKELELSDSSYYLEEKINITDHRNMDFSQQQMESVQSGYTLEHKIENNKATIELRGIDNGIITNYYFEKIEGKWTLISWVDSST